MKKRRGTSVPYDALELGLLRLLCRLRGDLWRYKVLLIVQMYTRRYFQKAMHLINLVLGAIVDVDRGFVPISDGDGSSLKLVLADPDCHRVGMTAKQGKLLTKGEVIFLAVGHRHGDHRRTRLLPVSRPEDGVKVVLSILRAGGTHRDVSHRTP